jgi:hypothetical protein
MLGCIFSSTFSSALKVYRHVMIVSFKFLRDVFVQRRSVAYNMYTLMSYNMQLLVMRLIG